MTTVKPLDLILFVGDDFISKTIGDLSKGEREKINPDANPNTPLWSHAGVVIDLSVFPHLTDMYYLILSLVWNQASSISTNPYSLAPSSTLHIRKYYLLITRVLPKRVVALDPRFVISRPSLKNVLEISLLHHYERRSASKL
jgi:hypothetical protein